jgi:glutathione synthase/RimK-type ligase-like ATP-grasp enzyme
MYTLFIRGINDNNTVELSPGRGGSFTVNSKGSSAVLQPMNFSREEADVITLFGSSYPLPEVRYNRKPALLFNEISNPDTHRGALQHCEELCRKLQLPVINPPARILQTTRDNISVLLKDIEGLEVPLTIRITPHSPGDIFTAIEASELDYPVIVRLAGTHGGASVILVNGREDLDKLHVFPYDRSDFYLTQFVDFASDDGYYRKLRIVVIDGIPLLRHQLVNHSWMVHASCRQFMNKNDFLNDEEDVVFKSFDSETIPIIKPVIDEITRRLQLQYYGIDCNLQPNGNMQVFEVNAGMNILFDKNPQHKPQVALIKQHIRKMLDKYATGKGQPAPTQNSRPIITQ